MTTTNVLNLEGKKKEAIELPPVFTTPLRRDVIRRAVLAQQSARYQRQGVDTLAGKRTSAESWGVGHSKSRVPRTKGAGFRSASQGAVAPTAVGGRRTHPPQARKVILERINKKERLLAIRSAIAATMQPTVVKARGHVFETEKLPIIVEDELEGLQTTPDVKTALESLGVWGDVLRVKNGRKVRSGAARRRNRKYRMPVGPLVVIAADNGVRKAARNIPGVTVTYVSKLSAEALAPGTFPGRLTLWTKSAIQQLGTGLYGGST
jgi:large subunit ribosomal protein L4e